MSTTFQETVKALQDNPELKAKVLSAQSAEDRASILREAGVPVPIHADVVKAHQDALDGVDGGGSQTNYSTIAGQHLTNVAAGAATA